MRKALVIVAGIGALAGMGHALASNPNTPKPCVANYSACFQKTDDVPGCAQQEIECRKFNKDHGLIDPSDPAPNRAGSFKPVSGVSPASPQGSRGSTLLKTNPGAATAKMPGAVSGAKGAAVTGTAVISTNGSVVTNSAVIVKRPGFAGGNASRPAGTATLKIQ